MTTCSCLVTLYTSCSMVEHDMYTKESWALAYTLMTNFLKNYCIVTLSLLVSYDDSYHQHKKRIHEVIMHMYVTYR